MGCFYTKLYILGTAACACKAKLSRSCDQLYCSCCRCCCCCCVHCSRELKRKRDLSRGKKWGSCSQLRLRGWCWVGDISGIDERVELAPKRQVCLFPSPVLLQKTPPPYRYVPVSRYVTPPNRALSQNRCDMIPYNTTGPRCRLLRHHNRATNATRKQVK